MVTFVFGFNEMKVAESRFLLITCGMVQHTRSTKENDDEDFFFFAFKRRLGEIHEFGGFRTYDK